MCAAMASEMAARVCYATVVTGEGHTTPMVALTAATSRSESIWTETRGKPRPPMPASLASMALVPGTLAIAAVTMRSMVRSEIRVWP